MKSGTEQYWTTLVQLDSNVEDSALVVVDMQRWCAESSSTISRITEARLGPDAGRYYFSTVEQTVIPNIAQLVDAFRTLSLPIIYLAFGKADESGSQLNALWRARDKEWSQVGGVGKYLPEIGSDEFQIVAPLAPLPSDHLVVKSTAGAFNSSDFEVLLKRLGCNSLYFTGVVTNGCVGTTVRDAADRGYNSTLVSDACASFSRSIQEAALTVFGPPLSALATTKEVIEQFSVMGISDSRA